VNDQLHSILGYSQSAVVDYIIALARKSKDVGALTRALVEQL